MSDPPEGLIVDVARRHNRRPTVLLYEHVLYVEDDPKNELQIVFV